MGLVQLCHWMRETYCTFKIEKLKTLKQSPAHEHKHDYESHYWYNPQNCKQSSWHTYRKYGKKTVYQLLSPSI